MNEQTKPHEAVANFGRALEGTKPFICVHEEFRHDCAKCLRQEIRMLRREADRLKQ